MRPQQLMDAAQALLPMVFPAASSSVPHARRVLRGILAPYVSASVLADVELMASELVANATVGAHSPCSVDMSMPADNVIRIWVTDFDHGLLPREEDADAGDAVAEDGRGLVIVAALASRWGSHHVEPAGKTVWFEASF